MAAQIIEIESVVQHLKDYKGKKVLVGGCFDVLHIGHIRFLKQAASQGNCLIVALESDEFIRLHKKREPFHHQTERAEVLSAIEFVDFIIPLPLLSTYEDYLELVKTVSPQIVAVTEMDSQLISKKRQAESVGAKVIEVVPLFKDLSTSKIISSLDKESIEDLS